MHEDFLQRTWKRQTFSTRQNKRRSLLNFCAQATSSRRNSTHVRHQYGMFQVESHWDVSRAGKELSRHDLGYSKFWIENRLGTVHEHLPCSFFAIRSSEASFIFNSNLLSKSAKSSNPMTSSSLIPCWNNIQRKQCKTDTAFCDVDKLPELKYFPNLSVIGYFHNLMWFILRNPTGLRPRDWNPNENQSCLASTRFPPLLPVAGFSVLGRVCTLLLWDVIEWSWFVMIGQMR